MATKAIVESERDYYKKLSHALLVCIDELFPDWTMGNEGVIAVIVTEDMATDLITVCNVERDNGG